MSVFERQVKNLEFKVDTCFKFLQPYYNARLALARAELKEESTRHNNLNLCYKHRQERNRSHFSEPSCDYCKLLKRVREGS